MATMDELHEIAYRESLSTNEAVEVKHGVDGWSSDARMKQTPKFWLFASLRGYSIGDQLLYKLHPSYEDHPISIQY